MDYNLVKTILIVALVFGLVVVLPIVAILTEHQRKMARLMRGEKEEGSETAEILRALNGTPANPAPVAEIEGLKTRVAQLEAEVAGLKSALPARQAEEGQAADRFRSLSGN